MKLSIQQKLKEYTEEKRIEHNSKDLKVEIIHKKGWIKTPRGYEYYLVNLKMVATGFKDAYPSLVIPKDPFEKWYIM